MKRYGIIIVILFSIVFAALMAGAGTPKRVENSKHNMSSTPFTDQGTIKSDTSGGTTEICVFCHTPHSGNTEAPLWNRALYPSAPSGYIAYTSDVLSALSYSSAEDPYASSGTGVIHAKTRICLSCHDGTIAIGRLVNLPTSFGNADPNTTFIAMQGTSGGYMPPTSSGNIGVDLRDDHPVAIPHNNINDAELAAVITTDAPNVNLYELNAGQVRRTRTGGAGSYVECTSCHNAHDNENGNFLVDPNTNSRICTSCHDKKTDFTASSHNTSGVIYAPDSGSLGGTVGDVKCMNCHFPHKAGVTAGAPTNPNPTSGKYLLSFQEEASCFNNTNRWGDSVTVCHGSNAGLGSPRNIETIESNASSGKRHWTQDGSTVGKHEATEGQSAGWIGSSLAKWHVECADCHNPHTAGSTNHTSPVDPLVQLTPASPLYGAGGVSMPGTPRTWGPVGSPGLGSQGSGYNYREPLGAVNMGNTSVQYEYETCFKCHTDFAWGTFNVPPSPSLGFPMTDQAMEFKTTNASYHPVVGGNTVNNQGTFLPATGWNAASGTQTMYCSDCHTYDNGNQPLGPHGSGNAFILKKPFADTYDTTLSNTQPSGDICFDCHLVGNYLNGATNPGSQVTGFYTTAGTNLHTRHYQLSTGGTPTGQFAYRCVNCHVRIPHGYNRKALIVQRNDGVPYEAGIVTGQGKIATATLNTPGNYGTLKTTPDCATVAGCHQ